MSMKKITIYKGINRPFNILTCLGRCFIVTHIIVHSKSLSCLIFNLSFIIEISLVAYEHQNHIFSSTFLQFFESSFNVVECLLICDIIHNQSSNSISVIVFPKRFESFLTSCIHDIDIQYTIGLDYLAWGEFYTDGWFLMSEVIVCVSLEDGGLPNHTGSFECYWVYITLTYNHYLAIDLIWVEKI